MLACIRDYTQMYAHTCTHRTHHTIHMYIHTYMYMCMYVLGLCDNENSPIMIIQPSIMIITIMPYILEIQQNYKYELTTLQFRNCS